MKTLGLPKTLIFALLYVWTLCAAPAHGQADEAWKFPEALRSALDSRLRSFTEAQAEGDWSKVALLLGRYRRGGNYMLYTPSHRACLINVMKQFPMIDFTYKVWDSSFSSEILSTPPERKWWMLVGEATFRQDSIKSTKHIYLTAYRDRGNWYFTPPPFDNGSAISHLTAEQLATDQKDKVGLRTGPGFPLEVVDLHVFIDKDNALSRKVHFRLRNKTDKRVVAYSYKISESNNDGSITYGTGTERDWIEPMNVSRQFDEDDVTSYYWCEGEPKTSIEVLDVRFEDGTSWNAPRAHGHIGDPK
ncbi:MAG: hypothetical protein P4L51_04060 [Puia sp.]|nr:hypothetical protein [Puia sp.]